MKSLTISGSSRPDSSNVRLLEAIQNRYTQLACTHFDIGRLPLFDTELDQNAPSIVKEFKQALQDHSAIIISTPEYIHNIPAQLKNALEWVTSSGLTQGKKCLALTYTPHSPRGEKAMQSMLWSLAALEVQVVASLDLYSNELAISKNGELEGEVSLEILDEAIRLLMT